MEADLGVTQMAMSGHNSRFDADQTLLVRFYTHPRLDGKASKLAGRNVFKDTAYIEIMTPGNKDSIVQRPATQMDIDRFPEHYRKYKARAADADQIEGTLLESWPAVTRSQCEELKYLNIHTVEQLLQVSDANAQGIMGLAMMKTRAKAFLEAAETQKAADVITKLQSQIDRQTKQIDKLIAESQADKPKRGRPPKEDQDAA